MSLRCLLPLALVLCVAVAAAVAQDDASTLDSNAVPASNGGGDTFAFLTVGDWGKTGKKYAQVDVAKAMAAAADKYKARFVLALGDNFYEKGVTSTRDKQWRDSFERIYTQPSLQVPWYVVLGNHDHHGNTQAQIDYSQLSTRWILPDYYYTKTFNVDARTQMQFVFIDTVRLTDGDAEQLNWISSTLQTSKAEYLIVVGHYPVYTGGEHGNSKTLINTLLPMMKQNHVTAYLSGHDHILHFLRDDGIDYYVSGGGAKKNGTYKPIPQALWGKVANGFTLHRVNAQEMRVDFVDKHGKSLYSTSSYPRATSRVAFDLSFLS